jgi:hypothetical protein
MWIALLGSLLAIGVALLCLLARYDLSAGIMPGLMAILWHFYWQ